MQPLTKNMSAHLALNFFACEVKLGCALRVCRWWISAVRRWGLACICYPTAIFRRPSRKVAIMAALGDSQGRCSSLTDVREVDRTTASIFYRRPRGLKLTKLGRVVKGCSLKSVIYLRVLSFNNLTNKKMQHLRKIFFSRVVFEINKGCYIFSERWITTL